MSQLVWCVCQSSAHFQDDGRNTEGLMICQRLERKSRLALPLVLGSYCGTERFSKCSLHFQCSSFNCWVKLLGTEGWHLCSVSLPGLLSAWTSYLFLSSDSERSLPKARTPSQLLDSKACHVQPAASNNYLLKTH